MTSGHFNQDGGEVTRHVLSLSLVKMVANHMVVIYSKVSPLDTHRSKKKSVFLNKVESKLHINTL